MKIIKISAPLPLNPEVSYGGEDVNSLLTQEEASQIEQRFGLTEHIGEGSIGIAYDTNDGRVLKLTPSGSEARASSVIMNEGGGAFAEVYEVGEINTDVYYILKEKVTILTLQEQIVAQKVLGSLERKEIVNKDNIGRNFINEIIDYYYEAVESKLFWDIDNASNIGRNIHGKLVCFDPMSE